MGGRDSDGLEGCRSKDIDGMRGYNLNGTVFEMYVVVVGLACIMIHDLMSFGHKHYHPAFGFCIHRPVIAPWFSLFRTGGALALILLQVQFHIPEAAAEEEGNLHLRWTAHHVGYDLTSPRCQHIDSAASDHGSRPSMRPLLTWVDDSNW